MSSSGSGTVIARADLTAALAAVDDTLFELATRYLGIGDFEDDGFVPTEDALSVLAREIGAAQRALATCDVPPGLEPFAAHLRECGTWLAAALDNDRDYPVNPLRAWIAAVQRRLFSLDPQDAPAGRSRFLVARLRHADAYLSALVDGASNAPEAHLEHCLRRLGPFDADLQRAGHVVGDLPGAAEVHDALQEGRRAVARCRERLEAAIDAPRDVHMRCRYEDVVDDVFGFDLGSIRGWCDRELEGVRERLEASLGGGGSDAARRALKTWFPAYEDVDELALDAERALARARSVAMERVVLPSGERLTLDDVPETDRDKLPFGAYAGGNVLSGDVSGRWLVNMANLRGVHRGWVWMMALHEGYPGHHVHYAKTAANDALPLTFRLPGYGPSQGLVEGVAHRSETYLETFGDQKDLWPMVPYRQLQTLLRIKTQLMISVEREPLQDAVAVYTSELGMDADTAGALVRSQTMNPGRTFSYFTGMRTLREVQQRLGADDAPFTESIFANGFVSLGTMEALLHARFSDSSRMAQAPR